MCEYNKIFIFFPAASLWCLRIAYSSTQSNFNNFFFFFDFVSLLILYFFCYPVHELKVIIRRLENESKKETTKHFVTRLLCFSLVVFSPPHFFSFQLCHTTNTRSLKFFFCFLLRSFLCLFLTSIHYNSSFINKKNYIILYLCR